MQLIALLSIPYAGVGQCPEKVQVEEKKVGCCKKKRRFIIIIHIVQWLVISHQCIYSYR